MASFGYATTAYHDAGMPDPGAVPEAYEGVLWRRTLAYFVDLCFIGVLALLAWIIFVVNGSIAQKAVMRSSTRDAM